MRLTKSIRFKFFIRITAVVLCVLLFSAITTYVYFREVLLNQFMKDQQGIILQNSDNLENIFNDLNP